MNELSTRQCLNCQKPLPQDETYCEYCDWNTLHCPYCACAMTNLDFEQPETLACLHVLTNWETDNYSWTPSPYRAETLAALSNVIPFIPADLSAKLLGTVLNELGILLETDTFENLLTWLRIEYRLVNWETWGTGGKAYYVDNAIQAKEEIDGRLRRLIEEYQQFVATEKAG